MGGGLNRPDFTDMTRTELFDWMNVRIKSGELSLDDSMGLLRLTDKGSIGSEPTARNERERNDFFRMAHDNISNARTLKDESTAAQMQVALGLMQRFHTPPA